MKKQMRSVCPVACTLDLFGDKWTLLIIRDLYLGRRYFKDFLASPERIATNILSDRLNRLLESDIVCALPDDHTVGRNTYALTEKGQSLIPLLEAIKDWGLANIEGTAVRVKAA